MGSILAFNDGRALHRTVEPLFVSVVKTPNFLLKGDGISFDRRSAAARNNRLLRDQTFYPFRPETLDRASRHFEPAVVTPWADFKLAIQTVPKDVGPVPWISLEVRKEQILQALFECRALFCCHVCRISNCRMDRLMDRAAQLEAYVRVEIKGTPQRLGELGRLEERLKLVLVIALEKRPIAGGDLDPEIVGVEMPSTLLPRLLCQV